MTKRIKWLILIIAAIVLIAAAVLVVWLIAKDDTMRVKALGGGGLTSRSTSDYEDSRLKLHDNGTFEVEIVYLKSQKQFTAIGTYTKGKTSYTFTFTDCWTSVGIDGFERDPNPLNAYINTERVYQIKNKRIEFIDHNDNRYYFA